MNIGLLVCVIALFALAIYLFSLELKSIKLLSSLTEKYSDGIDIGFSSQEALVEILNKEFGLTVKQYSNYIIVKVGKRNVKLFIDDGRVFTEYSKDKFGITRGTINSNRLLRASRLKKAVAANEIMDRLAMKFNPACFKRNNNEYQRALSYAKQYGISISSCKRCDQYG